MRLVPDGTFKHGTTLTIYFTGHIETDFTDFHKKIMTQRVVNVSTDSCISSSKMSRHLVLEDGITQFCARFRKHASPMRGNVYLMLYHILIEKLLKKVCDLKGTSMLYFSCKNNGT